MGPRAIDRRTLLAGLGALTLAACVEPDWGDPRPGARESEPPLTSGPPPSTVPPTTGDPGEAPDPTEPDETVPTGAEPLPDRAEIIERHGSRRPTGWGLADLPGLVERTTSSGFVLTLDLCGGPNGSGFDRAIVDRLVDDAVPTVFFVNRRWAEANPTELDHLLAHPDLFEIANHGTTHLPLSVDGRHAYGIAGTADVGAVYDEIAGNHELLIERTGRAPRWFRSGTAHYDDVAIEIVHELGEIPIGFDVNADGGATFTPAQVREAVSGTVPGSIIIGHANQPRSGTAEGLAAGLADLAARGLEPVALEPSILPPST